METTELTHWLVVGPHCWGRGKTREAARRRARQEFPGYGTFKVLAVFRCDAEARVNDYGYIVAKACEKVEEARQ